MMIGKSLLLSPSRMLLLATAGLLGACATVKPEPTQLDFELPESFANAEVGQQTLSDQWWQSFSDAQLNQFVSTALERNPALIQAIARTRIAEAQARLNRADQLPQAGLSVGGTRQRQKMMGMPGMIPGATDGGADAGAEVALEDGAENPVATDAILFNNYNASLDISWELDLWGRLSALSASARANYLASNEQLRAMRQSVAAQVVQIYFEIVHARAQLELSERTVTALTEMARQINNRVDVGIASPADGMLANANLASASAGLEQRREALERSLRQLDVIMGEYPAGALQTADALPEVPAAPAAGVPAELLARRPDVRAAELGLLGAGYQLGAAKRSFLPSLSLSGSVGYSGYQWSDLFNSSNQIWSIAGQVLQPIFQGGRLIAQVDIAEGQRDEALHAYAEIALQAMAEVESALVVESLLVRREAALETAASSAENAVQISLNRYLQGIDPFLNVLESQQRALDGRSAHITAQHARLENRVALHLALGGGFENTPLSETSPAPSADAALTSSISHE